MFKSMLAWGAMAYGTFLLITKPELTGISVIMFLFANNLFTDIRVDRLEDKLKGVKSESNKS